LRAPGIASPMRTTVAAVCIFLFLITSLLCMYQIGGGGSFLSGGYLTMSAYYTAAYGDRPGAFLLSDKSIRSDYGVTLLIQDARSMRFFKSRIDSSQITAYGQNAWIVQGVSQKQFFGYLQNMELGVILTGAAMVVSLFVPYYYDSRKL